MVEAGTDERELMRAVRDGRQQALGQLYDRFGGPLELRIPVGPTWLLDLRGPPGLDPDQLTAFLRSSADPDPPLFTHAPAPVRSTPRGGWPWVRFHGPPMDWWMQAEAIVVATEANERQREQHGNVPPSAAPPGQPR